MRKEFRNKNSEIEIEIEIETTIHCNRPRCEVPKMVEHPCYIATIFLTNQSINHSIIVQINYPYWRLLSSSSELTCERMLLCNEDDQDLRV